MPQRAPASIDMLQSVSRPSTDKRADRGAGKFDGMAGRAAGADMRDDGERDVLGRDARAEPAIDRDPHALRLALPDRLRHQHMRDFGGADAERIGAERAVGRRVAVAADDQQARQRQALLGADHMHDALPRIVEAEQLDADASPCSPRAGAPCARSRDWRWHGASRGSAHNGRRRRRSGPGSATGTPRSASWPKAWNEPSCT